MADMSMQLGEIVSKLLQKTQTGKQQWSPSLVGGRFQARFGNFTVELQGNTKIGTQGISSRPSYSASIKVTKLNGLVVAEGGSRSSGLISAALGGRGIDAITQDNLDKLYALLADRSGDLDELLELI